MRAFLPLLGLLFCACPQPEDAFVISGQIVDLEGVPRVEVAVKLGRARFASESRCEFFDALKETVTDQEGRFAFQLLRQEAVAGVNARRFFSVEAPGAIEGTVTKRFWFPNADLELGPVGARVSGDAVYETKVDGHVAWRGGTFLLDRPSERRDVRAKRDWISVPIDSLGRVDVIPIETRVESPWLDQQPREGFASTVIGAECPELPLSPCPLTDGRFLPYAFPPDVRQLLFNFKREANVTNLLFHGLQLARPATKARLDFSFFVDFIELSPLVTRTLTRSEFGAGVSLDLIIGQNVFTVQSISPTGLRSECSDPLEIARFVPAAPERPSNLAVSPNSNAATRNFVIFGDAPPDTVVHLHRTNCGTPVERSLPAPQFATEGVPITFDEDGFFTLAFDAVDELGQLSMCETVKVYSKTGPPSATFDFGSPWPTPEPSAWFVATGDFNELQVWSGPACDGIPLAACSQANGRCLLTIHQPDSTWAGPFSAQLTDTVGNTACVLGLPYGLDANASTAPVLSLAFEQLRVRVHVGRDRLDLFASNDCSGTAVSTYLPSHVIGQGLRNLWQLDGGVFSARSYVSQNTPDPCSLPISVP